MQWAQKFWVNCSKNMHATLLQMLDAQKWSIAWLRCAEKEGRKWYENAKEEAKKYDYPQVRAFAQRNELKVN